MAALLEHDFENNGTVTVREQYSDCFYFPTQNAQNDSQETDSQQIPKKINCLFEENNMDSTSLESSHHILSAQRNFVNEHLRQLHNVLFEKDHLSSLSQINESNSEFPGNAFLVFSKLNNLNVQAQSPTSIYQFLQNNLTRLALLPQICRILINRFSPNTRLYLCIVKDRDFNESELTLFIRQNQYQENLLEIIDKFMDDFGDQYFKDELWLQITTDFR